jgi:hypothetical protein
VYLMRFVDATYQLDPVIQQGRLAEVARESLPQQFVVAPSQTISGILRDKYRVSKSYTPEAYDILVEDVKQRNSLDDKLTISAGQKLLIPDLPPRAQMPIPGSTPRPAPPLLTTSFVKLKDQLAMVAQSTQHKPANQLYKTAVQVISLKTADAAGLPLNLGSVNTPLSDRVQTGQLLRLNQVIKVSAQQDATVGAGAAGRFSLSPAERVALTHYLAQSGTTNPPISPVVIVLDDAFPSSPDFRAAVDFVGTASTAIAHAYGLPADPAWEEMRAQIKDLDTYYCLDCEYPKLKLHSSLIKTSLEPLVAQDIKHRVKVIYLPFDVRQRFSKDILGEILRVSWMGLRLKNSLVLQQGNSFYPPGGVRVDASAINSEATNFARDILSDKQLGNGSNLLSIVDASGHYDLSFTTDQAIIEGVQRFLWLYSYATNQPHFLSLSWTAANHLYPPAILDHPYGLILAAAANDPKRRVQGDGQMYAALNDGYPVFAVGNSSFSQDNLHCGYSAISDKDGLPVLGVLFPGAVTDSICGTSFSTPRSAWAFAAREAVKGTRPAMMNAGYTNWIGARVNTWKPTGTLAGDDRYKKSLWDILEVNNPPQ